MFKCTLQSELSWEVQATYCHFTWFQLPGFVKFMLMFVKLRCPGQIVWWMYEKCTRHFDTFPYGSVTTSSNLFTAATVAHLFGIETSHRNLLF